MSPKLAPELPEQQAQESREHLPRLQVVLRLAQPGAEQPEVLKESHLRAVSALAEPVR